MSRVLIVAYRAKGGSKSEIVSLLRKQYALVYRLGLVDARRPWLMEGAMGEIIYIVAFNDSDGIDRIWEDPDFQDIDGQLALICEMVPIMTLSEASGSYIDFEELCLTVLDVA